MDKKIQNPFNITKAVDLSDEEILKFWVDLSDQPDNNLIDLIKPKSIMPMFIVGGKGSGKTHLIRYISFNIRKMTPDFQKDLLDALIKDGFLSIYLRCGGLNASRFSEKGISPTKWSYTFAYYIELWISKHLLDIIVELNNFINDTDKEIRFCQKIVALFDKTPEASLTTINELNEFLIKMQHDLDYSINNCIFDQDIKFQIFFTRGRLIYNIPNIFNEIYLSEKKIIFQYMLDEFENFTITQQEYINTLIRERSGDCSFKVGARLFGIKTHKTLSADEENKLGSEFDLTNLDKYYRDNEKFESFAVRLINNRIQVSRYHSDNTIAISEAISDSKDDCYLKLDDFDTVSIEKGYYERIACKPLEERTYFNKFISNISQLYSAETITEIKDIISKAQFPLLHKAAIHYIYTVISTKKKLNIDHLKRDVLKTLELSTPIGILKNYMSHYKIDFVAQLCREYKVTIPYGGLKGLIDLSMGNPRHLLILLKYIYDWAIYKNEISDNVMNISIESQDAGIKEAANWFYNDAKLIGMEGDQIQDAISRLCNLFRSIRFSDKPSECSLCTFGVDIASVSDRTKKIIDMAEKWSLIINVGTHNVKTSGKKISKYQINKILAPRWEIATGRRGTLQLSPTEANAIFDENNLKELDRLVRKRLVRMDFPFRALGPQKSKNIPKQFNLLGDE